MRYVAAYLLAVLGGNENPTADDIKRILGSVGIEADGVSLKKVISELNGKNLEELIAEGRQKMSSMPAGGGGMYTGVSSAPATSVAAGDSEASNEVKNSETKKEESEPESDEDMGFGLFD